MSLLSNIFVKLFVLILLSILHLTLTKADTVTLSFEGTVTSTDENSASISEVSVGDTVTGQYTFSTSSPDERPSDSSTGLYTADHLTISVSGFTWTATDNNIAVLNNAAGSFFGLASPVDAYELVSPLGEVSGPDLSGLGPIQVEFNIIDTDSSVFSDDSLPESLNITNFEITSENPDGARGGHIIFGSSTSGQIGEVRFEITEISRGSGTPTPSLTISPPSGEYIKTQNFDVVFIINKPSNISIVDAIATLNDRDIVMPLSECITPGTLAEGGKTFRCPGISGGLLGKGAHILSVTLELSNGSSINDTVTWHVLENDEP